MRLATNIVTIAGCSMLRVRLTATAPIQGVNLTARPNPRDGSFPYVSSIERTP